MSILIAGRFKSAVPLLLLIGLWGAQLPVAAGSSSGCDGPSSTSPPAKSNHKR